MGKPLIVAGDLVRPRANIQSSNGKDVRNVISARVIRRKPGANGYYGRGPCRLIVQYETLRRDEIKITPKYIEVFSRSFEIIPEVIDNYDLV